MRVLPIFRVWLVNWMMRTLRGGWSVVSGIRCDVQNRIWEDNSNKSH